VGVARSLAVFVLCLSPDFPWQLDAAAALALTTLPLSAMVMLVTIAAAKVVAAAQTKVCLEAKTTVAIAAILRVLRKEATRVGAVATT